MTRFLTAIPLVLLALYLVFWSPQPVFVGAAVLTGLLCYREYADLVTRHGIRNPAWLGVAGGLAIVLTPAPFVFLAMVLVVIAAFMLSLTSDDLKSVLTYVACVALGVLYTFAPWRLAVNLRAVSVHLLFFALALNWAGDSVAFYIGKKFGRHRLAPVASPKKSWEGAIAAVVGSVVFGLVYLGYFSRSIPKWEVILMAIAGNIAGQFGDLAESAMKRGAAVKDSGTLLPGHGGLLDRLDSSLFALPVVYTLVLFLPRT